jgi:prolyl-tRNA synthetase
MHLVAPEGEAAPGLYDELRSAGVEVLYDDRQESPGTKFMDADLIGAPTHPPDPYAPLPEGRRGVEEKLRRSSGSGRAG